LQGLYVKSSDTIDSVKAKIKDEYCIQVAQQRLIFNKKELEGGRTLAYYDIRNGSDLDLVLRLRSGLMEIYIRTFTGNTYALKLESSDTVHSVKEKIEQAQGLPIQKQRIIFAGKQLEGGRTLADYNITDLSSLHLVIRLL
jgi:ubiquitin C